MLKKLPLPIAGLMLALAALGNLIQSYSEGARLALGAISAIIFISLTVKILSNFAGFQEEMKNPVVASVMSTYSMGGMLLAGYLKPFAAGAANALWYLSVIVHIVIIIYFTMQFATKFSKETIVPSWFIVYVGIVVASVNGKMFNPMIGKLAFYFGFAAYIILLYPVINRLRINKLPEMIGPLLTIVCAPGSLCLAGYMNIFDDKNMTFVIALLVLAQLLYLGVLTKLPALLQTKFYPSFSGFTFPLVISAIGLKLTTGFMAKQEMNVALLKNLVLVETAIAVLMVAFVLIKYCQFLMAPKKA